jgi:hypothetical protein
VRNYLQSLIRGPVNDFSPKVMISYATGTRTGLDGEGCGLGMQYCHLVARHLERAGISSFTGLHVEGGYNWVSSTCVSIRRPMSQLFFLSPCA